jgi:hypothetical protein
VQIPTLSLFPTSFKICFKLWSLQLFVKVQRTMQQSRRGEAASGACAPSALVPSPSSVGLFCFVSSSSFLSLVRVVVLCGQVRVEVIDEVGDDARSLLEAADLGILVGCTQQENKNTRDTPRKGENEVNSRVVSSL